MKLDLRDEAATQTDHRGRRARIAGLAFDPSGARLAIALGSRVYVHDARGGGRALEVDVTPRDAQGVIEPRWALGARFSPDGRALVVEVGSEWNAPEPGALNATLHVFDAATGASIGRVDEDVRGPGVIGWAVSPDARFLAWVGAAMQSVDVAHLTRADEHGYLLRVPAMLELEWDLRGQKRLPLVFSDDGRWIVACVDGSVLKVFGPIEPGGAAYPRVEIGSRAEPPDPNARAPRLSLDVDGAVLDGLLGFSADGATLRAGAIEWAYEDERSLRRGVVCAFDLEALERAARTTFRPPSRYAVVQLDATRATALWAPRGLRPSKRRPRGPLLRQDLATGRFRPIGLGPLPAGHARRIAASADGTRVARADATSVRVTRIRRTQRA